MRSPPGPDSVARRIAILYHSAAGGTRLVAELLSELLGRSDDVTSKSIFDEGAADDAAAAEFVVLCYPTYFLKPSPSIVEFIGRLERPISRRAVYLVTTYELYTENSLRACTDILRLAGYVVTGSAAVRAPGSDLTCILPEWLCVGLYRFESRLPRKVRRIAGEVASLSRGRCRERRAAMKWYTPITRPLQRAFFDGFLAQRARIQVLGERCTGCRLCTELCHRGAWVWTEGGPRHRAERCELCTACIHHCPRRAIVLSRRCRNNRRLDTRFYAETKARARRALGR